MHTIFPVPHLAGWPTPEGNLGFLRRQQLAVLCRRWGSVITQGSVRGAQEASCWLWTCKDWCHLVLAVASHDPRELLHSQLVSQLFGAPLNKHKVLNSCFSYSFNLGQTAKKRYGSSSIYNTESLAFKATAPHRLIDFSTTEERL